MHTVHEEVLRFITKNQDDFDRLALAVFRHQYENIEVYRCYCDRQGRSPASVASWREVPPVPVVAFRDTEFCCRPAERVFLTTGTSRGCNKRGRHAMPDLRLYRDSALAGLRMFLFPDVSRMRIVSLIPSSHEAPVSSLAQMVSWAMDELGAQGSRYVASADGIDHAACTAALRASERDASPVCLLTTTAALIHLLDYCSQRGLKFRLPHGSRVMDTGGTKGAPRPLSRKGLLHGSWNTLAIPGYFCVNEYGMAELSSQFYENVIRSRVNGGFARRALQGPPWTRVRVLDPATLQDVVPHERGLLCLYDLANAASVFAVLTEDIGRLTEDGFEVCGRASDAEVRGCSLSASEWHAPS